MSRRLKPTNGKVLVEHLRGETGKIGSIHIPEAHQDKAPVEAVVVAVAAGVDEVKVGDRVVTARYQGTEVRVGNRSMKLLSRHDLLAVIE